MEVADVSVVKLVPTTEKSKLTSEWILDLGCSFHICPNKDLFSTYSLFEGGLVLIGNNSPCKVTGVSTVQIRMQNGIIRTLLDVRHMPDVNKNLISLGNLDFKGGTIVIKSINIKVSRGALVLMRGGKLSSVIALFLVVSKIMVLGP